MFESLKLWKLSAALKNKQEAQEAYAAVLELGRSGSSRAVELLVQALSRADGVSRAAARELGKLGDASAVQPLTALLGNPDVNQAASEALVKLGAKSVEALVGALQQTDATTRRAAAAALGEIGDKRAVESLIQVVQGDDDWGARTAAATALGQIKDQRALWVLVGTLKLRDEADPGRQAALEQLRHVAHLAMRKIGDPLAGKPSAAATALASAEVAVAKLEAEIESPVHPRLIGDISLLPEADLVSVLKELMAASEEVSWAKLEQREPMLPPHFQSYEQRQRTAEIIGTELNRRGNKALLKQVLARDLGNYGVIHNWWIGIGGYGE
jgi:HEAT repeat protein